MLVLECSVGSNPTPSANLDYQVLTKVKAKVTTASYNIFKAVIAVPACSRLSKRSQSS